ncbi:MAG: ParB/RepB/Spo0J family partition protein [Lachnospiraceae bacterium]|nr:ParB/RepB/Spo0J family partition protein [Lachnospiraceae bacterium]
MAKTTNVTSSLDNLFKSSKDSMKNNKGFEMIELDKLKEFPNHPYRIIDDESMEELSESIKEYGMQEPILAIEDADEPSTYFIISGHRRKRASQIAEKDFAPVNVLDIDMDLAAILMVDSNNKREHLSISEKAKAYRIKQDAIGRRQGVRNDLKEDSINESINSSDSERTIRRYIRLSYLTDEMLSLVDEGKIPLLAGVGLSYFDEDEQDIMFRFFIENKFYPKEEEVNYLRNYKSNASDEKITPGMLRHVFKREEKIKKNNVALKEESLYEYFTPGTPKDDMEVVILKLLQMYKNKEITLT